MRPLSRMIVGAAAATLATAVCVAAAPSVQAADGDIPILGQALTMGLVETGDPAVITVHGVRRVQNAVVVYWSVNIPKNAPKDDIGGAGSYADGTSASTFARLSGAMDEVALIDNKGGLLYLPLAPADRAEICVCSWLLDAQSYEPGQAGVFYTAMTAVPASVTTVDVAVGDQFIQDIPVEDGLMEPASQDKNGPWILGTGWPLVDTQAITTGVPRGTVPLTSRISDLTKTVTTSKGSVSLNTNVLFATDSATLTPKAGAALAQAVAQIKASGSRKLDVTGHTDSDGSDSYNLTLSKKRADAVATRLKTLLGAGYAFTTAGKGETQPIADNTTDSGKATNRRVTITFTGGK